MIDTSNQLKALRKERKLTIQAVCEGTGIAIRTYQNYEYGKREISAEALYKLADFYGVTTDFILGREPVAEEPDALFEEIEALPSEAQDVIIELLHLLSDRARARKAESGVQQNRHTNEATIRELMEATDDEAKNGA